MTIFRERDRRAEDRKRRSRGRGETKVEIRRPVLDEGGGGGFHGDEQRWKVLEGSKMANPKSGWTGLKTVRREDRKRS